jgi:hypothetical protein
MISNDGQPMMQLTISGFVPLGGAHSHFVGVAPVYFNSGQAVTKIQQSPFSPN